RIAAVALMPVCSPALRVALGIDKPVRAEDLARLPLLHDAQRQDWPLWFQAQGVESVPRGAMSGPSFDDQMLLIRAALSGQGVAREPACASSGGAGRGVRWIAPVIGMKNTPMSRRECTLPASSLV